MISAFFKGLSFSIVPPWARWAILAGTWVLIGVMSYTQGMERGSQGLVKYVQGQATETVRIVQAQAKVVTKIETVYRDRIQVIYRQGAKIETQIPDYIKPADEHLFAVNAGFVRVLDAAWTGEPAGPASDADREPARLPLADIAATEIANITSCRVWQSQALGWREFYAGQQVAINGKAGEWHGAGP